MSIYNQIYSVIVPAGSADFTGHTYIQVYAGANASPVINGQAITMAAGSTINIKVRSISNTAGIYLIGENVDISDDTQYM
jgi:hypothetical protein